MPARDLTRDRADMRQLARQRACSHGGAVEACSIVTGERLARLCPGCDAQLPPDHWIALLEQDFAEAVADA